MADLDKLAKRPMDYLWETGVSPMGAGLTFFLLGSSDLAQRFLPQTFASQQGIKLLALCGVVAALWALKSIKERVVFPRGGHVEPERHYGRIMLLTLVPPGLAILWMVWQGGPLPLDLLTENVRLVVPGFAVLFAVMSLYYGRKLTSPLLSAFGVYLLCIAPLIWWLPLTATERFGLLEASTGGPLAVYGALRLRSFLRCNPLPVDLTHHVQ